MIVEILSFVDISEWFVRRSVLPVSPPALCMKGKTHGDYEKNDSCHLRPLAAVRYAGAGNRAGEVRVSQGRSAGAEDSGEDARG